LDEVIRFACQLQCRVEKRLFHFAPSTRICVDDATTGQACFLPLGGRSAEKEEGEDEQGEGEVKHKKRMKDERERMNKDRRRNEIEVT
jgi:hypothetical protein